MFGYVLPAKGEMKVRDFETYRAMYCGVCKQLGQTYGLASRFLLNYDLVLLAVVADALSGEQGVPNAEGCFANPLARRVTQHDTAGLALGADGLMLLAYYKFLDDLADESFGKRFSYRLASPFMRGAFKKAAVRHPKLAQVLGEEMHRQQVLEAAGCQSLDEACEPTAKMCEALFAEAAQGENERRILARLGLFCGQVVYLLDAAEDYDDDLRRNRFNVLVNAGLNKEQAVEAVKRRCRMAAGEIALCYNLLKPLQYKDILDNIFFLGLPAGIDAAGAKRMKRSPKHGQINSL